MRVAASLAFVLMSMIGAATAQSVFIDYDKEWPGGKIETFAWVDTEENSVAAADPLMHSRIVNGIEYYLSLAGAREVESDPQVYVTYHASSKEEVHLNTSTWDYGYPSGWAYGGYYGHYGVGVGTSTTTVSTYLKGTLVVDVWDAKTKKLIWRGMATDIVVTADPAKMEKKIDKALKKMVDKWQSMKEKMAKEKAKAEKKAAKG
jgi:hypothetical protein